MIPIQQGTVMKMNKEIYFTPLGGGQEVGASCYFLKLGDEAILLDAGIGKKNGFSFGPSFLGLENCGVVYHFRRQ